MPTAVQVQCPAKVNLFLEVTGRRADGYHTLASLFAKISLFDVLDAERTEAGLELEVVDECGQGLRGGPENLVWKAAESFRRAFRVGLGSRLKLTKRIPMGAGLGGGSSDAAGTLIALARLYGLERAPKTAARLRALAAKLGADVPFFLHPGPLAEARGIGERLTRVRPAKALPWMILVYPNLAVPTPAVYGRLVRGPRAEVLTRLSDLDKLKKNIEKGRPISVWEGLLFNRLETAVLGVHPEVEQAKRILERMGLRAVLMSGSGSSVFGFASSHEEAERQRRRLQAYPWKVFLTCCLG